MVELVLVSLTYIGRLRTCEIKKRYNVHLFAFLPISPILHSITLVYIYCLSISCLKLK